MRNCTRLSLARMKLGWECDGRRKWQEFDWLWVSAAVSVAQGTEEQALKEIPVRKRNPIHSSEGRWVHEEPMAVATWQM